MANNSTDDRERPRRRVETRRLDLRAALPARDSVLFGFLVIVLLAGAGAYLQVTAGATLRSGLREVTLATVDKALGAAELSRDIRQLGVAVEQLLGEARRDLVRPSERRDALRDANRARNKLPVALDSLRSHLASTRAKSKALVLLARRDGIEERDATADVKRLGVATFYLSALEQHVAPLAHLSDGALLSTDAYVEDLVEPRMNHLTRLIDDFSQSTSAELQERSVTKAEEAIFGVQRIAVTLALAIAVTALLLGAVISRSRRKAESLIASSERKFRNIVEATGEWIWSADANWRLTYSNPTVEDILGYTPDELLGRSSFELLHEEERETAVRLLPSEEMSPEGSGHVLRWRHKDGSLRYLENHVSRLMDERGSFVGWTGVNRDVTKQYVSQQALQASEEQTRRIIETASDAFIGMDGSGMITHWNQASEDIFGWPREEVVGRRLSDVIIPPSMRAAHDRRIRGFDISKPSKIVGNAVEVTALHRDGHEFPVESTVWAQESDGALRFNAVLRDITVRKRTEEALRSSEERFRALVQNATDVIVVMDESAVLSYVSPSIEHIAGFT
ncbi:MAG: PAS domain S-box protein, partial [Actinobacteria bacterium]|nr:PAS domain S-box protein [Actinomycetota bacterium]